MPQRRGEVRIFLQNCRDANPKCAVLLFYRFTILPFYRSDSSESNAMRKSPLPGNRFKVVETESRDLWWRLIRGANALSNNAPCNGAYNEPRRDTPLETMSTNLSRMCQMVSTSKPLPFSLQRATNSNKQQYCTLTIQKGLQNFVSGALPPTSHAVDAFGDFAVSKLSLLERIISLTASFIRLGVTLHCYSPKCHRRVVICKLFAIMGK